MTIDSHCHLHFPQLRDEAGDLVGRMAENSVTTAVLIGTSLDEVPLLCSLLDNHPQLFATVGVHPTATPVTQPTVDELVQALAAHPRFVAIGESGLDRFHVDTPDVRALQRARFATQIEAALGSARPLVVHTRNARDDEAGNDCIDETIATLTPHCRNGLRAVLHCFTGTASQAQAALDAGMWLSFTGIITYGSAADLLKIAASVPLDRLMVETDAPYLAPVPHRGTRNEPAYVRFVAERLAGARDMGLAEFDAAVTATTRDFYGLPATA